MTRFLLIATLALGACAHIPNGESRAQDGGGSFSPAQPRGVLIDNGDGTSTFLNDGTGLFK